jgi:riboflavin synthase
MFSGIVEQLGRVDAVAEADGARRLRVRTGWSDLEFGESIAVNGVCLTVAALDGPLVDFFVSAETLDRSNLGRVREGGALNLERAITLASRLSGHLVQGHVDGRARLVRASPQGESHLIELELPRALRAYCVEKGSIALNGVSLTLNGVGEPAGEGGFAIGITLIPHTWTHTNLQACAVGDELNVEVDVLAKYVERLCQPYLTPSNG